MEVNSKMIRGLLNKKLDSWTKPISIGHVPNFKVLIFF